MKIRMMIGAMALLATGLADAESVWMTGPLLAAAGTTIPKGHINIEPYVFYTDNFAVFDSHRRVVKVPDLQTLNVNPIISLGLSDSFDLQGSYPYNYNTKNQQHGLGLGDIALTLGYQALRQTPGTLIPDLRAAIGVSFPTGDYENLDPRNQGTDANGAGSYQTTLALNFQRVDYPFTDHAMRTRLTGSYTLPHKTSVKGFNAYGGGVGTNGVIRPASQFQVDMSFEYQLTQNWIPVFEVNYLYRTKSSFSGFPGFNSNGSLASMTSGSGDVLSFAPAVEYNFSGNLGIIAGVWFSTTGRLTSDFASGVLAVNYYS